MGQGHTSTDRLLEADEDRADADGLLKGAHCRLIANGTSTLRLQTVPAMPREPFGKGDHLYNQSSNTALRQRSVVRLCEGA